MSLNVFVSVNGEGEGVFDGPDPADDPAGDPGVEAEDIRDDAPDTNVSSPHRFHIFEDVDAEVDPNGVTAAIGGAGGTSDEAAVAISENVNNANVSSEAGGSSKDSNKEKKRKSTRKGWARTRDRKNRKSPVPPQRNLAPPLVDTVLNSPEHGPPSASVQRPKKPRSVLEQTKRKNASLETAKRKLTDSKAALKLELDQVRREKKNMEKKMAKEHAQAIEAKDNQIAAIRDEHAQEIAKLKRQLTEMAEHSQSQRRSANMVFLLLHDVLFEFYVFVANYFFFFFFL